MAMLKKGANPTISDIISCNSHIVEETKSNWLTMHGMVDRALPKAIVELNSLAATFSTT